MDSTNANEGSKEVSSSEVAKDSHHVESMEGSSTPNQHESQGLVREKSSTSTSTKPRSGILKSGGSRRSRGSAGSQKTRFSAPSPDEASARFAF